MKNTLAIYAIGLVLLLSACSDQETTTATPYQAVKEVFGQQLQPKQETQQRKEERSGEPS